MNEAEVIIEGDELALKYFHSQRLVFAHSTMPAGGRSPLDPGHEAADEIVYVIEGQIAIEVGDKGDSIRVGKGDAALIHASVPHTVYNPGPGQADMIWATAPGLGRADRLTGE